jgi:hypothetical protein
MWSISNDRYIMSISTCIFSFYCLLLNTILILPFSGLMNGMSYTCNEHQKLVVPVSFNLKL